ncbi:MAG: hypothetical protein QOH90_1005 [Actinomycetota bacterium]|jgi:hypothetical protein|nr:hypothetical protein [Actinomycetota bacterium]
MLLALLVAIIAAGIAVARGGSLDNLARTRFRWTQVLFAALLLQILFEIWTPASFGPGLRLAVTLVSIAGVLIFLVLNRSIPGALLASIGLALNVLVITVNGAMPVSLHAADIAGISFSSFDNLGIKHEILTASTRLPWLADILPVPHTQKIFSFGDVVLAAGLALLAYNCAMRAPREESAIPRAASG